MDGVEGKRGRNGVERDKNIEVDSRDTPGI